MKLTRGLALLSAFFVFACQPAPAPIVTILDNGQIITLQTEERVPSALFAQAGITLHPNDSVLINGLPVSADGPIPNSQTSNSRITLQLRRALNVTLITPDGPQQIQSSSFNVGEILNEASLWLRAGDEISTPLDTPSSSLESPITITQTQSLTITTSGQHFQITSSAQTVGAALAEAGIPLVGLDYSIPAENEPLPTDGNIKVVRVNESLLLAQKPIPFESDLQASADVPLDQTQIIQPGETGLSVQRIRIRYEDGAEVARLTENETVVRPPKMRILGYGTKVEIKTTVVDGVQIEYWRAVQMFATSYSPCRSAADRCYFGTSSGLPVKKGVAGMKTIWFNAMGGQQFYIPGYGFAILADSGGAYPDGRPHIDLGYSDDDYVAWHEWVTVYFLTPVPPNVIYVLE